MRDLVTYPITKVEKINLLLDYFIRWSKQEIAPGDLEGVILEAIIRDVHGYSSQKAKETSLGPEV